MEKGNCKHGKFDLMEGCPQCTADRMAKEGNTEASIAEAVKANQRQIVKVQYYSQTTGEISDREYTYYSIDRLQVGDIVQVPVRDTVAKAKVSAIDVSAAEIAAFADKVKTIPGCSVIPPEPEPASIPYVMPEEMRGVKISSNAARLVDDIAEKLTEPEADAKDTTINLCDTCMNRMDYPNCLPSGEVSAEDVVEYGDGLGNDNIIKCPNHKPETAVALRPGEDIEAQGYHKEAVKALEYAEMRVIATVEDVKMATDDLSIISKLKKAMEKKKREHLDPLREKADAIRETYSTLMDPIFAADKITRDKMLSFSKEQERIRATEEEINRKRMEAAQEEMKLKGELSKPVNLIEVSPEPLKRVSTSMGTTGQRLIRKWEVVNSAEVPDDYKIVDAGKVNKVVKAGIPSIPGIRIWEEPIITVNTK